MKWKITQQSYIDDRLVEPGTIIERKVSKPGPHWEPADDEAKAFAAESGVEFTGEVPDVLSQLVPLYADALKKANEGGQKLDVEGLKEAFKGALADLLDPSAREEKFAAAVKNAVAAELNARAAAKAKDMSKKEAAAA